MYEEKDKTQEDINWKSVKEHAGIISTYLMVLLLLPFVFVALGCVLAEFNPDTTIAVKYYNSGWHFFYELGFYLTLGVYAILLALKFIID